MSEPVVSQLNIYPVKSLKGISISSAWVEKQGILFDRRFMLAKLDGSMVTARKYPHMVNVVVALTSEGIICSYPNKKPIHIRYCDFSMQEVSTTVWSDTFTAYATTRQASEWFSDIVREPVSLLFTGKESQRYREKVGNAVSFADGYPLLVISQGSLDELNRSSSEQHSMAQFRTNIVVEGGEPFVEDSWKTIQIGEVIFNLVKPCERCILTTVDVEKGAFRPSKEPLKTLSTFRANESGGVFFGQNMVAMNEGMIQAGDKITVLEYKEKEQYQDNRVAPFHLTCVDRYDVAKDFVTFSFTSNHPEVLYKPGQYIAIDVPHSNGIVTRHYTLSSSPSRPDRLAISVKRVADGQISNWLLDEVAVGDSFNAQLPDGDFYLDDVSKPILLLSAGSGVTPMLSMVRYLADINRLNDVVFYHQCRSEDDIPYASELNQLQQQHSGFTVIWSLTQPQQGWNGQKGRLSLSHIKQIDLLTEREVFVCGPDGFMQKAKSLLLKKGLPEDQYHQENFTLNIGNQAAEKAVQININGVLVKGNNQQTILEQAENNGVSIPNSCRAGLCGACRVNLISGNVIQPDVPALSALKTAYPENNMVLACCCVPTEDVKITQ
ncbi:hybrid-cluster NAD(P)-dependent oxidoreductase [Vibrio sp.]|nr:hybrid-cluster NAD(P)-dependent oxidoreductase [Vibrio sp.]